MKSYIYLIVPLIIIITGCAPAAPTNLEEETPKEPKAEEIPFEKDIEGLAENSEGSEVRETKNVIYQGIVKPAGISIYMEGSHRLLLPDGRFILLESDGVDLNGYVNEQVELLGALRPTVEGAGTIMRVESARLIIEDEADEDENTSEDDVENTEKEEERLNEEKENPDYKDTVDDEPGDPPIAGLDEEETIGEEELDAEESEKENDEEIKDEPIEESFESEEPSAPIMSDELKAHTNKMAKESLSADNWTQEYCTAHIGFCVPIHRNWWFKSFGTTNSFLWHLELSSAELTDLYDGPIQINLLSGSVGSKKATDKQVRTHGDKVIGFRSWTDSRHFQISAPAELEEAVRYITENLKENEE